MLVAGTALYGGPLGYLLQVKPLEHSLENVNGRGCNETASGKQA